MGADEIHARTVCGLYRRACAEVLVVRTGNPCAYFRYGLLESLLLSKYLTVETVKADGNLFTIGGAVMKSFDDKAGTIFCTELRDRH